MHVHIHEPHLADQFLRIRALLEPEVTMTAGGEIPASTTFLITEHCPEEELDRLSALRQILFPCAGVPAPMRPILSARPHLSAHNLHYNNISVAETALALLFATSKRLLPLDRHLRQGSWTPSQVDTSHAMLSGSKCLLLGFGAIGQTLAPILEALGIKVQVMKRTANKSLSYPCCTPENWKAALPEMDILISSLPATPETHQLIDREALAALPKHALFINVGRGENVDEEALFHALKNGSIAGAGMDVWWNYPPNYPFRTPHSAPPCFPSNQPFHELENVVMLPHRGADHRILRLQERLFEMIAERITQAARGEELPNRIDPERGY